MDQERLTFASRYAAENGIWLLQGYRLAPTEREHIAKLLRYMDPPPGSRWVDIGCGFGEPARLMQELRPDLRFQLVNNNSYQLTLIPEDLPATLADMHALPFADAVFDGAMFLYSLCHAEDVTAALREAARVTRPAGALFVFDYLRDRGDDELSQLHMAARFVPAMQLPDLARQAGWEVRRQIAPAGDDRWFREVFGDQALYASIFDDLTPTVWRADRR